MQRLFSIFPSGAPGAGLLLLRAAAGVAAIAYGLGWLSGQDERTALMWIVGSAAIVSGLSLLGGLLTPGAGGLVAAIGLSLFFGWLPATAHGSRDLLSTSLFVIVALAIVLLGPGAYSLDAYLFGRREIVIPDRER